VYAADHGNGNGDGDGDGDDLSGSGFLTAEAAAEPR